MLGKQEALKKQSLWLFAWSQEVLNPTRSSATLDERSPLRSSVVYFAGLFWSLREHAQRFQPTARHVVSAPVLQFRKVHEVTLPCQ